MINKALILGRLGKDVEIRQAGSQSVANFSVATSEKYTKDGQQHENTEWHNIVVWGKQADHCAKYLHKGSQVFIEGKLTTRSWDDKEGNKRYKTEIVALPFGVRFLGGNPEKQERRENSDSSFPSNNVEQESTEAMSSTAYTDFDNIPF